MTDLEANQMRCKSCDEIMTEREIVWYEERKEHEEFCSRCKAELFDILDEYGPVKEEKHEPVPK